MKYLPILIKTVKVIKTREGLENVRANEGLRRRDHFM